MLRNTIFIMALLFIACSSKKTTEEKDEGFIYGQFSTRFKTATVPFVLTDTFLLKNKDTASISGNTFEAFIADSLKNKLFGLKAKIKFVPLYAIKVSEEEHYYIVKGETGSRKAALLLAFIKDQFVAAFPFLTPDEDDGTQQQGSIDKSFSISKTIHKKSGDVLSEGKDVYVFNKDAKAFTLIMTDPLDEKNIDLINPIDTLTKLNKMAGDYSKDKRNIVSVRDGRRPNLLTVFVHIEKDNNCTGELKGDAEITSSTTAVYREAGDPCILQFTFTSSTITLAEVEGCGGRRGLECSFNGSFSKKKVAKPKLEKGKKAVTKK